MDSDAKKKTLIVNFIDVLSKDLESSEVSEDKKESIEVALQCLESAYDITSEDKANLPKSNLIDLVTEAEQVTIL